jgi:hypothetical protein
MVGSTDARRIDGRGAYRLEVGLLLNFGSKRLTFKRLVL